MSVDLETIDCRDCPSFFSGADRRERYAEHRRQEHARPESPNLTCVQCTGLFGSQKELDRHARIVHGPALCPDCTWRSPNKAGLGVHRKRDHGMADLPPSYGGDATCPDCDLRFTPQGLVSHRRYKHKDVAGSPDVPTRKDGMPEAPEEPKVVGPSDEPASTPEQKFTGIVVLGVARKHEDGSMWIEPRPERESVILALAEALNRYGWHRETCSAWTQRAQIPEVPACELDDPARPCDCGFRDSLSLVGEG